MCALAGGGWCVVRLLCGGVWCGRAVCDCSWGVEAGDRHADVWVSLGYACGVGWCMLLLQLSHPCMILSYSLDYG